MPIIVVPRRQPEYNRCKCSCHYGFYKPPQFKFIYELVDPKTPEESRQRLAKQENKDLVDLLSQHNQDEQMLALLVDNRIWQLVSYCSDENNWKSIDDSTLYNTIKLRRDMYVQQLQHDRSTTSK